MRIRKELVDNLAETLPPSGSLIGEVLEGKYKIITCIGEGNMGTVYKACHLLLDRCVAIKMLRPQCVADPIIVERFHREARAAARIDDPRVVKLFEYYDKRREGRVFLVMEVINGITLKALLDHQGRLTPEQAVALMLEICGGVGAAHQLGVVHRDLKPGNIMLPERNRDKDNETVKIVDFGICKLPDFLEVLTQPGVIMGTPYYMSPEQCRGLTLDVRADVYSLGAIIYQMITGTPPFTASSILDVLMKHSDEEPAPLTGRAGVSAKLNSVIMRALAKEPQERQADARELARELQDSLEQSDLNQQRRWWQDLIGDFTKDPDRFA